MRSRIKPSGIVLLAAVVACSAQVKPGAGSHAGAGWMLPNFSDCLKVSVSNPTAQPMDALAKVDIDAVRKVAPGFPGTLAIVVEEKNGTRFLPSQVDAGTSSSGDGAFVFAVKLTPHERQQLSIYYSETLKETLPWPKRVHATQSYGYNRATAAIESELIGYRTYGGFFLDVQAHRKGELGLFNSLVGYSRISKPPAVGEDVIHLGDTLGLGGVFLRADGQIFRPPLNTPNYARRPAKPDEPSYRILATGPLRALVEARLPHWKIGNDEVALRAIYEMREGQEDVRCHFWIEPLRVSRSYQVGAGIRDLPLMRKADEPGLVVLAGLQAPQVGSIALGLAYAPHQAHRAGELTTPDDKNQIVLFDDVLHAGDAMSGEYSVAAAWEGSGWSDPLSHLRQRLLQEMVDPVVQIETHGRNPQPGELESEPQ
jgi:hypothetical protein